MAREELKTIEGWRKSGCNSWDEYCKFGRLFFEYPTTADNGKRIFPGWRATRLCSESRDRKAK